MILNKKDILEENKKGNIIYRSNLYELKDFTNNQSVDVHIGEEIYIVAEQRWINIKNGVRIPRNAFFLAYTEEFIGSKGKSNILPEFHQRSTWARLGLIHTKAGWGDVGYSNRWTMEFLTANDVQIQAGDRVGQITFTKTLGGSDDYTKKGAYQVDKPWSREDILPKLDNK